MCDKPAPQNHMGWVAYNGGDQPEPDGTIVQVKFRDHSAQKDNFKIYYGFVEDWTWRHDGTADDIVSYRVGKVSFGETLSPQNRESVE